MLIWPGRRWRPHPPSRAAHAFFFFFSHSSREPLGVSATRGGFSSEVSCALGTSLPNFSSLRSTAPSQVDCALDAGLHSRGARAPAEPEPQRFSGWTRASQVQVGCQARAWARGGAAARVLAGWRGGSGIRRPSASRPGSAGGEGARRAASLPARRRRRRPRQTMNLRARRAKAGLGPAPLDSGLPKAIEPPPAPTLPIPPPVLGALRAPLRVPAPCGERRPWGGAGLARPTLAPGNAAGARGSGDQAAGWRRCGQAEAGGRRARRWARTVRLPRGERGRPAVGGRIPGTGWLSPREATLGGGGVRNPPAPRTSGKFCGAARGQVGWSLPSTFFLEPPAQLVGAAGARVGGGCIFWGVSPVQRLLAPVPREDELGGSLGGYPQPELLLPWFSSPYPISCVPHCARPGCASPALPRGGGSGSGIPGRSGSRDRSPPGGCVRGRCLRRCLTVRAGGEDAVAGVGGGRGGWWRNGPRGSTPLESRDGGDGAKGTSKARRGRMNEWRAAEAPSPIAPGARIGRRARART